MALPFGVKDADYIVADATSRLHNNLALTWHTDDKRYKQRNKVEEFSYAKHNEENSNYNHSQVFTYNQK